jgi:hypothetical protein
MKKEDLHFRNNSSKYLISSFFAKYGKEWK